MQMLNYIGKHYNSMYSIKCVLSAMVNVSATTRIKAVLFKTKGAFDFNRVCVLPHFLTCFDSMAKSAMCGVCEIRIRKTYDAIGHVNYINKNTESVAKHVCYRM